MPVERGQVERWLREDLGHHDVNNDVPGETDGRLGATESGVVAGLEAAVAVFDYLDVDCEPLVEAGDRVEAGAVLLEASGATRDVLRGERVVGNVVGHASGVATRTRRAVNAVREAGDATREAGDATREAGDATREAGDATREAGGASGGHGDPVRVAATRKTTPGLRGVEKRAVAAGGGDTHRLDTSHMIMVKDNHIAALGLETAVDRFRERASFATRIEVEVDDPADAPRAADAGADVVLLDNMSPEETRTGVELLPHDVLAEASGGITVEELPAYVRTGVDVISLGSLTHSAPALDVSFRVG